MKLSVLMVVNAVVAAVFGAGFVVVPAQVLSLYSPEVTPPLQYVAQLFGAALLAFAVLTWHARNAPDSEARRAILLALCIGDSFGFIVALNGQLDGVVTALGWSTVAIYLLFAIGFGYFIFVQPKSTDEAGQVT
jgi:hypothetical protein